MTDEQIAWIIHEAHRAYQMTSPLDPSHVMPAPPWVTMTKWQKQTVINQVRGVREDMEAILLISDKDLAARSHDRWVQRMSGKGWTWGADKDPEVKTHPCLTDWDKLAPLDQAKTLQAVAIAKVHLAR